MMMMINEYKMLNEWLQLYQNQHECSWLMFIATSSIASEPMWPTPRSMQ